MVEYKKIISIYQEKSKIINILFRFIFSILCFWYLFDLVSGEQIQSAIKTLNSKTIFFAFISIVVGVLCNGIRYRSVCKHHSVSLEILFSIIITGGSMFLNQFFPGSIGGEILRYNILSKRVSHLGAVGILLSDRILGLLTILLFLLLSAVFYSIYNLIGVNKNFSYVLFSVASIAMVFMASYFLFQLIPYLKNKISPLVMKFYDLLCYSLKNINFFFAILGSYLFFALSFSFLVWDWNSNSQLFWIMLAVPVVFIVVQLPLSIGGWGARELVAVQVLSHTGVSPERIVTGSVTFGVLLVVCSIPFFILYLLLGNKKC